MAEATEIRTCAESLLNTGVCCTDGCTAEPAYATLDADLVEHTRCFAHLNDGGPPVAHRTLHWRPAWAPRRTP